MLTGEQAKRIRYVVKPDVKALAISMEMASKNFAFHWILYEFYRIIQLEIVFFRTEMLAFRTEMLGDLHT